MRKTENINNKVMAKKKKIHIHPHIQMNNRQKNKNLLWKKKRNQKVGKSCENFIGFVW